MKQVFLSLGSNIGNRIDLLQSAVKELDSSPNIHIQQQSSYYETDPIGYIDQNKFINQVIEITTNLDPPSLLSHCLNIEKKLGRIRLQHWGPRNIDIDILLYENFSSSTETLTIPHPRMTQRQFVLIPLNELAPNTIFLGLPCNEWLKKSPNQTVVKLPKLAYPKI